MNEENNSEGIVKGTIEAATGLVQAVPVYNDLVQPAAQEIGKGLATMAKLVHVALAPISGLVWGYEKVSAYLGAKLEEKLKNTPPENIVTPDPHVVGPAIESMRFTGHNQTLAEMYANLIANAMDKETVELAHPSFAEIIKNLTSDEALILDSLPGGYMYAILTLGYKSSYNGGSIPVYENMSSIGEDANLSYKELTPNYLNNLCRLGLLTIPPNRWVDDKHYDKLRASFRYIAIKTDLESKGYEIFEEKKYIKLTDFGKQFKQACLVDKSTLLAAT